LNKSDNSKESILLRPHTSVMRYYYLKQWPWLKKLQKDWEVRALSWWKVYRVDDLDKTHHECFHQIDGLKLTNKDREIINQETLKTVLIQLIKGNTE
jgi:phenylalanyl-tRNA synthetase alpha subunit